MSIKPLKILLTGGNGFVGRQICRIAEGQGVRIVSLSRTGKPTAFFSDDLPSVEWVTADVFDLSSWRHQLMDCQAVIHSIGIIAEAPERGLTFERTIFESARLVGQATRQAGISRFVFLSAAAGAPDTPAAYMENKLAAERFLQTLGLDLTILRPGLIYGPDKPETIAENAQIQQLLTDPVIGPHIWPTRPLPVESVAKVAVRACLEPLGAILTVDDIERIAAENG